MNDVLENSECVVDVLGRQSARRQSVRELMSVCAPHQKALLRVIAAAHLNDVAADPLIRGMAQEVPKTSRVYFFDLSEQIKNGKNPIDAIQSDPDLLPPSSLLSLQLAREDGQLDQLYSEILNRDGNLVGVEVPGSSNTSRLTSLLCRSFLILGVLIFFLVKVVPEFQKMLEEFGIASSSSLRLLMSIADKALNLWFVLAIILFIGLYLLFPAFKRLVRRVNPLSPRQPANSQIERMRSFALISDSSVPQSDGLKMMSDNLRNNKSNRRLQATEHRIESGEDTWVALNNEKLISDQVAQSLSLTSSRETQAWLLRWSATSKTDRQHSRHEFFIQIVITLVNILIGFLVALTAVSVFMTLIDIMANLN